MGFKALASACFVALSTSAALACGFHTYAPQPTLVDRLLASEHIVLARPDADNPFRFAAFSSVEGPLEAVELPHLVDSATRRRFANNDDAYVLFARDGAYGPWERIAYVDSEMQRLVEHVIGRLPDWRVTTDDRERFVYFGGLIDSPSPEIKRLALRELDQASYGVLRSLNVDADAEDLAARLGILSESDLAPIRILLLGMTETQGAADFLQAGVDRNKVIGANALLGAYATAWVEHSGLSAARVLAADYLTDRTLPFESREMIIEALAIHAEVRAPETAEAVREAVASAVRFDPALAPAVARQFGIRNDWSLRPPVAEALYGNRLSSIADIMVVSQYVALADEVMPQESN